MALHSRKQPLSSPIFTTDSPPLISREPHIITSSQQQLRARERDSKVQKSTHLNHGHHHHHHHHHLHLPPVITVPPLDLASLNLQHLQQHSRTPVPVLPLSDPTLPLTTTTATTGAPAAAPSAADCYTCRRRRVKCDRQLPLCAKCLRTGIECLGYKKPLVWNKGVASRGKMMGKTFPAPEETTRSTPSPTTTAARRKQQLKAKSGAVAGPKAASPKSSPITLPSPILANTPHYPVRNAKRARVKKKKEEEEGGEEVEEEREEEEVVRPGRNGNELVPRLVWGRTTSRAHAGIGSLPGELTLHLHLYVPTGQGSPFGHLSDEDRKYMDYFENRVARDLVLFDRASDNPYRHLVPTAAQHPALLNGMLAVAARHHSNLCGTPGTKHLPYQNQCMKYLGSDLQRLGSKGMEATLAVVMLFIFFETLDGGLNTWKIHLRGARRVIRECLALESLPEGTSAMLRIFMNHVTLVDIIGRTLAFGTEPEPVAFDTEIPEYLSVLRDGEAYNFLGCPAELLEIIHAITLLKCRAPSSPIASTTTKHDPHTYLDSCQEILARIDAFAPDAYLTTRNDIDENDPPGLLRLVYGYKCAARIYAVETLFPTVITTDTLAPYHAELRAHLSALDDGSMYLKGAVWLVFIAGTGARTEAERVWTRRQLGRVWALLPQWNIRNAGAVLEELWVKCEGTSETAWRRLQQCGRDWLFV